jgi:hypothetical protein
MKVEIKFKSLTLNTQTVTEDIVLVMQRGSKVTATKPFSFSANNNQASHTS